MSKKIIGWGWFVLTLLAITIIFGQTARPADLSPEVQPDVVFEQSPFGFEVNARRFTNPEVRAQAEQLGATWARINTVSWRQVQPTRERDYNWEALESFEDELQAIVEDGLTPIVVVDDSPDWATKTYYLNGQPYQTSCGAIRTDRFADFAAFMQALVARYKQAPYNVQYWEFGNEVDIDPSLVKKDNVFGCWGDIDDPYYGGEHYGDMLQAVTPSIKRVDPTAQILIGGLLLNSPDTKVVGHGKPERFFEGILRSGAADSFDIVAFHGYSWYQGPGIDSDVVGNSWSALGGITIGKAKFLREVMQKYGVDKPLFYNETGFLSTNDTPGSAFFETQADHLVRSMTRAMSVQIQAVCWYTLNGPGWRLSGLLDHNQEPRPAYTAAQHFITQTSESPPPVAMSNYGTAVEAYRFTHEDHIVDVVWSKDPTQRTLGIPAAAFVAAHTRDGERIEPIQTGTYALLEVSSSPIYITRTPPNTIFIPQITAIAPDEIMNNLAASLIITGTSFVETPTIALNTSKLSRVSQLNEINVKATVPARTAPGTYDLILANPNGYTAAQPNALTVISAVPKPRISGVRPDRGVMSIPGEINIYGLDFLNGASLYLDTIELTDVTRINGTHLRATIPTDLASGTYDLILRNPNGSSTRMADAYTMFDATGRDLLSYSYEFWTDPIRPHANEPIQVGLVVHEQGQTRLLNSTSVRFYQGNPATGGDMLDENIVRAFALDRSAGTATMIWTPPTSGEYTLYAVIDPDNDVSEQIESNNIVSRTLTVLPPGPADEEASLQHVTANLGEFSTTDAAITLQVGESNQSLTSEPPPDTRRFILFVEYEYNLSAGQWIPVQWSGWLPHTTAQSYPWELIDQPGVRYIQTWVANESGYVAATPNQTFINVTAPTHEVAQNQNQIYRYTLSAGDHLTANVAIQQGDIDLYIWSPDAQQSLWVSNRSDEADEEIRFVAPVDGTYQVEIDALTNAAYQLDIQIAPDEDDQPVQFIDVNKVLRPQPLVPVTSEPIQRMALPPVPVEFYLGRRLLYLPLLQH